jgi:potassium-dependent mechanosensitive channel
VPKNPSSSRFRHVAAIALAFCLSGAAFYTLAADPPTIPTVTLPPSHASAVESALKTLANRRDLDADTRKQAEDLLHQAQDDETHADQLVTQRQALAQLAATADTDAQKIEDVLARDPSTTLAAWKAALPARPTDEQLEALLAHERDGLADARAAVASLQGELARQTVRPALLGDELTAAHAALDAIANPASPSKTTSTALSDAQRLRAQSAQRLATLQISQLNLENSSYEPRMRLLSAQLRERQRAQTDLTQHVITLEAMLLDRTNAAIVDLQTRTTHEREEIGDTSHMLAEAADANVSLATKLGDAVRDLGDLRTHQQEWDRALRDTAQALKNTEERMRISGSSEAMGLILLAERSRLKPVQVLKRQLAELQENYAKSRTTLIDVREQQDAFADSDNTAKTTIAQFPDIPKERVEELRASLSRLFDERSEILSQVSAQLTRLANAQSDAEVQLQNLIETTDRFTTILDARLLWTPSHKSIDGGWLGAFRAAGTFFSAARWARAFQGGIQQALHAPLLSICALATLALLGFLSLRARKHFENISIPMRRIRSDRYRLTSAALVWTILSAAPLPFAVWLIGMCLQSATPQTSGFADELGIAFESIAIPTFLFAFLRALTAENGLAQFHFRWPRPRRLSLYNAAPWLALLLLPAQFLIDFMLLRNNAPAVDTYGRSLLMLALLVTAAFCGWLLAPGRVWTLRDSKLHEPVRLRQIVRIGLVSGCLVLLVLVLRGYFVTALTLSARVFQTFAALLAASVLYGLGARWLVLGERHLSLKRMEEKQASENQLAATDKSEGETLPEPEPEEITLASVSMQTRRLLRMLVGVGLAASLLWIWSDVAPALTVFGDTQVWKSSDLVDGKAIALKVSLRDVLEALVAFALTWAATRNVPGFLEVGVLRRFNVDAPTRYAITSLTRYIIVFVGVLFGISMLGLHWSNLQWLAAGFSVGLGFGMQEIFANFISGLMVLFERPIRVGDIVTIGNIEGTVKRIRTRATTIVDWDNREVIVPNKNFITDRLVNWTLSDSTTRLVIKVGIAYRNDPKLAQTLMLDIANAHPQVLQDPAPTCWMMGFGNSTQDFELRVYVADIGQRNPVRTELQFRIAETFGEKDIELAFPQMDLWFRNGLDVESKKRANENIEADQPPPNAEAINASKRS